MNITPTTVKAYNILITESELRAAIADPATLAPHLKAALNGAFDETGGGSSQV